jgi:hypothetical protein
MRSASCDAPISIENTATGKLEAQCDVLADVERERGLAHRRPARHDHEVAFLQAGGHSVQVAVTGGHAGDVGRVVAVVQRLDAVDHAGQQRSQPLEILRAARPLFGDMQHLGLGFVEDRLGAAAQRVVRGVGDLAGRRGQLAQNGPFADDRRVVADIRGRRHVLNQGTQVGKPADIVELLHGRQRLRQRPQRRRACPRRQVD